MDIGEADPRSEVSRRLERPEPWAFQTFNLTRWVFALGRFLSLSHCSY